jgi:hypothetical protein
MIVFEVPAMIDGAAVAVGVAGPGDGCGAAAGWRTGAGAMRRDCESGDGSVRLLVSVFGGLTSIGGSGSEEAVCCALAGEILRQAIGIRKLEASKQVRRRFAAVMMEDMVLTSV